MVHRILMESQKAETWRFASNDSNDSSAANRRSSGFFAKSSILCFTSRAFLSLLLVVSLLLAGCMRLGVRSVSTLVPEWRTALFEECDPILAREALPANLKMMEGLLRVDPENRRLLVALSMGFTGYAMMFLEHEAPERASALLLRARDYGLRALGGRGQDIEKAALHPERLSSLLEAMGPEHLEPLFWSALAWSNWIRLNLDDPAAAARINAAQACIERAIELDGDYFYGLPYVAMGTLLAARPPLLGGDPEEAKTCFERALSLHQGRFLLAKLYLARYYAVRVQDRRLFLNLLDEIEDTDPRIMKQACLFNAVARVQANQLRRQVDTLFF